MVDMRALVPLIAVVLAGHLQPARADSCAPLEMRLMQLQGGGGSAADMQRVRDLLAYRGCRGAKGRERTRGRVFRYTRDTESSPIDRLQPKRAWRRKADRDRRRAAPPPRSSTVRTMCVRRCDGYFFPISFSTTRDRLPADEEACQRACPAGDAALFFHGTIDEGPEDMMSVDGVSYASLDNAFRFRAVYDRSCTCGRSYDLAATAVEERAVAGTYLPNPRPARDEDPETLQNRAGGFSDPYQGTTTLASINGEERPVRVILPALHSATSAVMVTGVPN